jgi:hypothetical protein
MMDDQIPKYVTQARASFLLGLPMDELRRISHESGIGHLERAGGKEEWFFTYEELQQICILASHAAVTTH